MSAPASRTPPLADAAPASLAGDDERALLERAGVLLGRSVREVASLLHFPLPSAPSRHKGVIGHLVERALGAEGGSRPGPDFACGVELKTLPIDERGRPLESTFVTVVGPSELALAWERSHARAKLAHVLFLPVEGRGVRPFLERRFGHAFAWRPSAAQAELLARDYELLREQVLLYGGVSAHEGEALQIRPKGRNARDEARGLDVDGAPSLHAKRAFYLRASFTEQIVRSAGLSRRP